MAITVGRTNNALSQSISRKPRCGIGFHSALRDTKQSLFAPSTWAQPTTLSYRIYCGFYANHLQKSAWMSSKYNNWIVSISRELIAFRCSRTYFVVDLHCFVRFAFYRGHFYCFDDALQMNAGIYICVARFQFSSWINCRECTVS